MWKGPSGDAEARKVAAMAMRLGGEEMMGDGSNDKDKAGGSNNVCEI